MILEFSSTRRRTASVYKVAPFSITMSSKDIPNELTTLKSEMQKDVEVNRSKKLERKSQWIQVRS